MNKTELVEQIAAATEMPKSRVATVVDTFVETIIKALSKGDSVGIVGFGTFNLRKRNARVGRNPQTGEAINIAAQNSPGFSAGKRFKDACNSDKK